MRKLYACITGFLLSLSLVFGESYSEVIFSHSLVKGAYAKSQVEHSGKSWVQNVNGNLPISDTLFFTPGNSLFLNYISQEEGDWSASVLYPGRKIQYRLSNKDILHLKLYVESEETKPHHLPKIQFIQDSTESDFVSLDKYIDEIQYGEWLSLKIPLNKIQGLKYAKPLTAVSFSQNQASGRTQHHIFIDQIEFLEEKYPKSRLSSAAVLGKVKAYGHHVHLNWQLPLSPGIRYVKIYRSTDNENFDAIALKPVHKLSSLDYIPQLDKDYYYKVTWVNFDYEESPFSSAVKVRPEAIDKETFLDLIQLAHVNYFVESFDVNSGMYMPYRIRDRVMVSTKGTGYAILSLIVGAEKGFISRNMALRRISRIVYFLQKAQQNQGFFPSYFNGRTGTPDYFFELADYDVNATASIIESLLISREYFNADEELEKDLRNRITALWERVDWASYTHENSPHLLIKAKSYLSEKNNEEVIGGVNENMNAYFLAMASPKHALDIQAFKKSVLRLPIDPDEIDSLGLSINDVDSVSVVEAALVPEDELLGIPTTDTLDKTEELVDSIVMSSVFEDAEYYGMNLRWKNHDDDLLRFYSAFMTINPQDIRHKGVKFEEEIGKLILFRKRYDNEMGVGAKNLNVWGTYQDVDSVRSLKINPAISVGAMFAQPKIAYQALQTLYSDYGEESFSEYGFRSWMDLSKNDVSDSFNSLNQVSVAVQIENARSGLIWRLYKEIPEIQKLYTELFEGKEEKTDIP